ncbi:MAG: hypothetical protein ACRDTH_04705 [Pseudonocardiaceae bacterium]
MSSAPRGEEIRAWVTEALSRVPMPDAPVREPWTFAPSALIAPRLPRPLARVPGLLDRFGAIRLTPHEIGIDTARPVAWEDVVELRTLPLLDLLTTGTSSSLAALGARLLPPVPRLADGLLRAGAEKAAEAVRSLLLIAASAHAERAASVQVPAAIVYRSGWWGHKTMTAGLFSSAVLALPRLTDSVVATAQQHSVPITVGSSVPVRGGDKLC